MKRITREKLKEYNGIDGKPASIAYMGQVYDVTDSFLWKRGKHQVLHSAGIDLTEDLKDAPHGEDMLSRVSVVGILLTETDPTPQNEA